MQSKTVASYDLRSPRSPIRSPRSSVRSPRSPIQSPIRSPETYGTTEVEGISPIITPVIIPVSNPTIPVIPERFQPIIEDSHQLQVQAYDQKYGSHTSDKIGEGAFGVIYTIGDQYVRKIVKNVDVTQDMLNEIGCLTVLRGMPNIIYMYDYFWLYLPELQLNLILERANYNFMTYMNKLHRTQGWVRDRHGFEQIVLQLCNAVEQVHRHNIMHRDIKAENFLVTDDPLKIKLTDFGIAITDVCTKVVASSNVYTLSYRPPELINSQQENEQYSLKADIWALGLVIYESYLGTFHLITQGYYQGISEKALMKKAQDNMADFLENRRAYLSAIQPESLRQLLEGMLEPDPKQRLDIYQVLRSDYFEARSAPMELSCFDRYFNLLVDYGYQKLKIEPSSQNRRYFRGQPRQYNAWVYLRDQLLSAAEKLPPNSLAQIQTSMLEDSIEGYAPVFGTTPDEISKDIGAFIENFFNNMASSFETNYMQILLVYLMKGQIIFSLPDDFIDILEPGDKAIRGKLQQINLHQKYVHQDIHQLILEAFGSNIGKYSELSNH